MKKYLKNLITFSMILFMIFASLFSIIIFNNKENNNGSSNNNTYNDENTNINNETEIISDKDNNQSVVSLSSYMIEALVPLNVREYPTTDSNIIGTLSKLESVNYLNAVNDEWYQVYYENNIAYISSYFEYSMLYRNLLK